MSKAVHPSDAIQHFDCHALKEIAQSVWPHFRVDYLPEVDSTNSELMRRSAQGNAPDTLLLTGHQKAGRGRLGKIWQTNPLSSLPFSLGVTIKSCNWGGLSLAIGTTLIEVLQQLPSTQTFSRDRLGLKWPNDVWSMNNKGEERKMAGILIETRHLTHTAAKAIYVVVGVGINLQQYKATNLRIPMSPLNDWLGYNIKAQILLEMILPALLTCLRQFEKHGFQPFAKAFKTFDLLHNRHVCLSDGRQAVALGVDNNGALLLRENGAVEALTSGEVSVRPIHASS